MELQLPVALQIALYAASAGIVVFVVGLLIGLLYLKKQIDRLTQSVENLKTIVEPLIDETRDAVQHLRSLTARIQEKLHTMERMVSMVQSWGREASRVIERSATVVTAPIRGVSQKAHILTKGIQAFFRVLLSRTP